jgi:hypothetical protein
MAQTSENRIMVLLFFGVLMGALDLAIVGGGEAGYQAAFTVLAVVTGSLFVLALGLKSRATERAEATTSPEA